MLQSKWSDAEARRYVDLYAGRYGEDVALRTYSARLLGSEPSLVLHGGGNTSVKSFHTNIFGQKVAALYVKGSGWDLSRIEPPGHPGLDLTYLRSLRELSELSDEAMVNELRTHLFDAAAPTPSIETLLHAFLPVKFIDHSHANALLTLTNTEQGEDLVRSCFGDEVVIVPYVMPGFALAKRAAELFDKAPRSSIMVLMQHGFFSWGETARESYERHLEAVNRAEGLAGELAQKSATVVARRSNSQVQAARDELLPMMRGALALRGTEGNVKKRFVFALRNSEEIQAVLERADVRNLFETAPLTPDHIIRTKQYPLIVERCDQFERVLSEYRSMYDRYFEGCKHSRGVEREKLDSMPRVIVIPGVGVVGVGDTSAAAHIAADIFEQTIKVKQQISCFSTYRGLSELDLFDVEYWELEQAKLRQNRPKPLHGNVALITGGAGAIGQGIAEVLKSAGCEVVVTDVAHVEQVSQTLGVVGLHMDVTCENSVREAFSEVVRRFGGIDIVIPNAGLAASCSLESLDETQVRSLIEVNLVGCINTLKHAAKIFRIQNSGGHIVVISSKNVLSPGREFSIYSATKAAAHQLGRVAALELASYGVKVNMVTPDAVFGTVDAPSGLWQAVGPDRAKARGVTIDKLEEFYRERNLLKSRVTAQDVGRAVLFFVTDQTPTTGAVLPVDGGIPEAFPR